MYEDEIADLEERIKVLKEKQSILSNVMTWREACIYMMKKGEMLVHNKDHSTFHGYSGVGILYNKHVLMEYPDNGYWRV